MEFIFLSAAGATLFTRSDIEQGHWVQEELSVNATFPYDPAKPIQRGQRIAFRDPATDDLQVFEIRAVSTYPDGSYQQLTAEHIAVAELQDEHINALQITDKTAQQALSTVLTGTLWSVGTNTASGTQNADTSRGSVWQAVKTIEQNWNVYITPRVVISSAGQITGRYLDITPAGGTWHGLRLSIRKNMLDPVVTYNDEEVLTALYGYGGSVDGATEMQELTFADAVWTATSSHPAKPSGQTYLEWPEKTALYGRNGRPRYGYYQNAQIKDASVLLEKTWEALKRTADPKISISGTVADLYRLGYTDQPLRLHDLAMVEIEETGETFYKEIIRLDVDLVDPSGNMPEIGDYIPNIIYINRETAQKAGGGGGGAGNRGEDESEDEIVRIYQRFVNDETGIGMVVGYTNGSWEVKAGEIVLAINNEGGTNIKLSADTIDIDGLLTFISSMCAQLYLGHLDVDEIACYTEARFTGPTTFASSATFTGGATVTGTLSTKFLTVDSESATWKSKTVVTSVTAPSLSRIASFSVVDTNGTTRTGRLVTSWSAGSSTTATINYLGKADS